MKVMVTSWRGHHEAVLEPEVAQMVFEKMTGKRTEALPTVLREKIPDTFQELENLWRNGGNSYTAFTKQGEDVVLFKDWTPEIEDLLFIAPVIGG